MYGSSVYALGIYIFTCRCLCTVPRLLERELQSSQSLLRGLCSELRHDDASSRRSSRRASRHCMLALLTLMTSATKITLYTHTACPFAQRVWIALEHTQVEFVRQDVNLYGSGGFDKRALKQVEERGGLLPPKGYIPVLAIGDDLFRESDHCVRHRVETQGQYGRPAKAIFLAAEAGPRLQAALSVIWRCL